MSEKSNPSQSCGAGFRVSSYWAEADSGLVPSTVTEKVNDWIRCNARHQVGKPSLRHSVGCDIYPCQPLPRGGNRLAAVPAGAGLEDALLVV